MRDRETADDSRFGPVIRQFVDPHKGGRRIIINRIIKAYCLFYSYYYVCLKRFIFSAGPRALFFWRRTDRRRRALPFRSVFVPQ